MSSWRAHSASAIEEHRGLADILRRDLGTSAELRRILTTEPLSSGGLLHPDYFDLRNVIADMTDAGQPPLPSTIIGALQRSAHDVAESRRRAAENLRLLGVAFDLDATSPRALGILRRAVRTRCPERIHEARLVELQPDGFDMLREAVQLLKNAWPEALDELQIVVSNVLFFDFPGMLGFSGVAYHGGIFLQVDDLADPAKLAENILHEGSHVRLNAAMANVRYLLSDDDERRASPLRDDPRPMFGIFHQMFVLGRMIHFYNRLRDRLGVDHPRRRVVGLQFVEAHRTVCTHARLTRDGVALTDALSTLLAEAT